MNRPGVLTQRVHPHVYRGLAVICLVLAIPIFVAAINIFQRGGAACLEATTAATSIGVILLVAALGAFKGARCSVRERDEIDQRPALDERPRWSSARIRWLLALCCFFFSALSFVPTVVTFVEWRCGSGPLGPAHPLVVTVVEGRFDARLLGPPRTRLPPLGLIAGSAFTVALFAIGVGLISLRRHYVAWGLLLFLAAAVGFMFYECFLRQFLS